MIKLKAPLELKSIRPMLTFGEDFSQRILGNYELFSSELSSEDMMHLLTQPPEVYLAQTEGSLGFFTNTSIENKNIQKSNIINNFLNRIMLSESASLTYQDRVYITDVLSKLGITDIHSFTKELFSIKKQVNDYSRRLSDNFNLSSYLSNEIQNSASYSYHRQENKSENAHIKNEEIIKNIFDRMINSPLYEDIRNLRSFDNYEDAYNNAFYDNGVFEKQILINAVLNNDINEIKQQLEERKDVYGSGKSFEVNNNLTQRSYLYREIYERLKTASVYQIINNYIRHAKGADRISSQELCLYEQKVFAEQTLVNSVENINGSDMRYLLELYGTDTIYKEDEKDGNIRKISLEDTDEYFSEIKNEIINNNINLLKKRIEDINNITRSDIRNFELKLIDEYSFSDSIENILSGEDKAFSYSNTNIYEYEASQPSKNDKEATEAVTKALLLNLVSSVLNARREENLIYKNSWYQIAESVYHTAETSLQRMSKNITQNMERKNIFSYDELRSITGVSLDLNQVWQTDLDEIYEFLSAVKSPYINNTNINFSDEKGDINININEVNEALETFVNENNTDITVTDISEDKKADMLFSGASYEALEGEGVINDFSETKVYNSTLNESSDISYEKKNEFINADIINTYSGDEYTQNISDIESNENLYKSGDNKPVYEDNSSRVLKDINESLNVENTAHITEKNIYENARLVAEGDTKNILNESLNADLYINENNETVTENTGYENIENEIFLIQKNEENFSENNEAAENIINSFDIKNTASENVINEDAFISDIQKKILENVNEGDANDITYISNEGDKNNAYIKEENLILNTINEKDISPAEREKTIELLRRQISEPSEDITKENTRQIAELLSGKSEKEIITRKERLESLIKELNEKSAPLSAADKLKAQKAALENPEEFIREYQSRVYEQNELKEKIKKEQNILNSLEESNTDIYTLIKNYLTDPSSVPEGVTITKNNIGALLLDSRHVEETMEQREKVIRQLERYEASGEGDNGGSSLRGHHIKTDNHSEYDVREISSADIYHKTLQNSLDEETLAEILKQTRTETEKTTVSETKTVNTNVIKKEEINDIIEEHMESRNRKIEQMIQSDLTRSINSISDKVYRQIEKRLSNERRRRGV